MIREPFIKGAKISYAVIQSILVRHLIGNVGTNIMNDLEMYLIECGLNADERNTVLAMVHDYTTEFLAWQESDRND